MQVALKQRQWGCAGFAAFSVAIDWLLLSH